MADFDHAAYGEHKRKIQPPLHIAAQNQQFCERPVIRDNYTQHCGHVLDADGECANASAHLA